MRTVWYYGGELGGLPVVFALIFSVVLAFDFRPWLQIAPSDRRPINSTPRI